MALLYSASDEQIEENIARTGCAVQATILEVFEATQTTNQAIQSGRQAVGRSVGRLAEQSVGRSANWSIGPSVA